jgi:metallo-beta-lactamase class B
MRVAAQFFTAAFLSVSLATGQDASERVAWNQPVTPFQIIGNVYYVGAAGVSAFLIRTDAGDILLDGGLPETAPRIVASISALGADIRGVKYLLNSHAHYDHGGGLAELKQRSGAQMAAMGADAVVLEAGGSNLPAVKIDRILRDGDTVTLGGTTLTAHHTPGHTKGCTTWTMTTVDEGKPYDVVFHCSTSVVDTLAGNTSYPNIVSDYEQTFEKLRALEADVFLASHPGFFDMADKLKRRAAGEPNPFIDAQGLQRFNQRSEAQFRAALAKR